MLTTNKVALPILEVYSKTRTQNKNTLYWSMVFCTSNGQTPEKIPGFERVKQISIGCCLYGSPKAFKQLLKCCSDRHHSSLNLEMRCRLKMIKKKKKLRWSNELFKLFWPERNLMDSASVRFFSITLMPTLITSYLEYCKGLLRSLSWLPFFHQNPSKIPLSY